MSQHINSILKRNDGVYTPSKAAQSAQQLVDKDGVSYDRLNLKKAVQNEIRVLKSEINSRTSLSGITTDVNEVHIKHASNKRAVLKRIESQIDDATEIQFNQLRKDFLSLVN